MQVSKSLEMIGNFRSNLLARSCLEFATRICNFPAVCTRNDFVNALYVSRGCWNNRCVNDRASASASSSTKRKGIKGLTRFRRSRFPTIEDKEETIMFESSGMLSETNHLSFP